MNAIELLGTLLGGGGSGGGSQAGAQILRDILGGGQPQQPAPQQPQQPAQRPQPQQVPVSTQDRWQSGGPDVLRPAPQAQPPLEEEAAILIRAMLNAARADGRMDRDEEQKILRLIGQPTPEVVNFIRAEFEKPVNVRDFAWSVPLGMEEKVYTVSLAAIVLDERSESDYLKQLSHGLRLNPQTCAAIHQRYGAPVIS
jgi:uncharacterized membrane protein YebE (DUF533 family)